MGMKAYPSYRDCVLPWLPAIPSHWEVHRLGAICNKKNRIARSTDNILICSNNGTVFPRNENTLGLISDKEEAYQGVEEGDLLIHGMDTWHGAIAVSKYSGKCTKVVHVCESSQNKSFVAYFLQMLAIQNVYKAISNGVRGNTSDFRSWNKARIIIIAYPPTIEEQNAIVAYLDKKCAEIDELVTRRQAIIERLKELKQSIIADAVTKGLNPDVPMMDSGIDWLGEVPQHWEKYRTPSILKVTSKAGTDSDELLSVYLDRGVIRHSESDGMQVHKPSKDMSSYQKVLPGNFVCNNQQAWRGSVGVSEHEGRISPAYIIFNLSSKLVPKFANYFFRSQAWNPSFVYSSKGVGSIQRNLYLPWLRQHYCYLPSTEEQQAIVAYLDKNCAEIDELVVRQEQIIEKLKELKTSTIAHVVTGKVDVRDAI